MSAGLFGTLDLPLIWAGLIAFAVFAYVMLDGFTLGVGILFPLLQDRAHRDDMMNSVAPVWDGNETWLVLGGGGLMAAFPLAFAVIMPALYAPIIAMLIALVFRGVAFEFRWRATDRQYVWDRAFALGSLVAAFAQGVALGALVQGIPVANRAYAGGWWDWLTPFSILTGIALIAGYALLGATWLIAKCDGLIQDRAYTAAKISAVLTLALIGAVSLWTPFLKPLYWARWFGWPQILLIFPVPLALIGLAAMLWRGVTQRFEHGPFYAAQGIFALCFVGLGISFYPYMVPHAITIRDAAAPPESLRFLLIGASVLLPIILAYTAYAYYVFRGKVRSGDGYH